MQYEAIEKVAQMARMNEMLQSITIVSKSESCSTPSFSISFIDRAAVLASVIFKGYSD